MQRVGVPAALGTESMFSASNVSNPNLAKLRDSQCRAIDHAWSVKIMPSRQMHTTSRSEESRHVIGLGRKR